MVRARDSHATRCWLCSTRVLRPFYGVRFYSQWEGRHVCHWLCTRCWRTITTGILRERGLLP